MRYQYTLATSLYLNSIRETGHTKDKIKKHYRVWQADIAGDLSVGTANFSELSIHSYDDRRQTDPNHNKNRAFKKARVWKSVTSSMLETHPKLRVQSDREPKLATAQLSKLAGLEMDAFTKVITKPKITKSI